MSLRPIFNEQVIEDGDMSGNLASIVTFIQKISEICYIVSWSGTAPVGTLQVQISNDYAVDEAGTPIAGATWIDMTGMSYAVASTPGSGAFDIPGTGAKAIRLIYTRTSGSGTLQAFVNGKAA